jgi:hypothetical protein
MNKDLLKIQKQKEEVVEKLNDYTNNGIMVEQVEEFNDLCRQEFIINIKEKMMNYLKRKN